jgi:hypothetical protein
MLQTEAMPAAELKKHAEVEASIHDNHGARQAASASQVLKYEQTARSGRRCSRVGRRPTLASCGRTGWTEDRSYSIVASIRTAVEPEHERLLVGRRGGLEEPVEERAAVRLVHGHVPGVLREPHGRLPREPRHPVRRLLRRGHRVHLLHRDGRDGAER